MSTGTDRPPHVREDRPDIFISHATSDPLARKVFDLIQLAIYGGDRPDNRKKVFFTSDVNHGLDVKEQFDTIMTRLDEAKHVIAVVTPDSVRSIPVIAEMSAAYLQKKLIPVVVREDHRPKLLRWPFGETEVRCLNDIEEINNLLRSLGAQEATLNTRDVTDKRSDLAQLARALYPEPKAPPDRRPWLAVAAVVLLALAVLAGFSYRKAYWENPRPVVLTPNTFNDSGMRLHYSGTLPRRLLSTRLAQINAELGKPETTVTVQMLMDAVRATNSKWLVSNEDLARLESEIAQKWDGGGSNLDSARGRVCTDLKKPVDQLWCEFLESKLTQDLQNQFDQTAFAVLSLGPGPKGEPPEFQAVVSGSYVKGSPQWKVANINALVLTRK